MGILREPLQQIEDETVVRVRAEQQFSECQQNRRHGQNQREQIDFIHAGSSVPEAGYGQVKEG
jgi:hypothetical protein